jgi:hypothetical protein
MNERGQNGALKSTEVKDQDISKYNEAKKTLWNVAAGVAALVAFSKFGSKLGDSKCAIGFVTAAVLSGSLEHGALVGSLLLNGKNVVQAFKGSNWPALAKSALACGIALAASSTKTQDAVWTKVATYVETVK